MLKQLTINNFAIIDKLEITFKDGLTVLIGETGAGKSIIADALDFLLGSRGSSDLIKSGTNKAIVEGTFDAEGACHGKPLLDKNGFDTFENELIISRELTDQGSKVRINGSLANVSHLLSLKEFLLDIHEQSEHIELLKIEKQSEILDNFGDNSHKKLLEEYRNSFGEFQSAKNKLNDYLQSSEDTNKQIDFLKFQTNEINLAKIIDLNEDSKLAVKREILLNKKELIESANLIHEIINGENQNNLLSLLSQIKKLAAKSSEYDKSFQPYVESIESFIHESKDLSSFTKGYFENTGNESEDLKEIEERLDLLYSLKKKYGGSLENVKKHFEEVKTKLNETVEALHAAPLLEEKLKQKEVEINIFAEKLTKSRESITRDFVNKINEELKTLGFKQALFVIEFTQCELSINGKEQIQFLFTANPDEPPRPLLKVASGGELSRIMLAIKSITCKGVACNAPTMIFDEIDMGVSGEIAASVAKKLYKISKSNQVIAITHQPIICAMADSHFAIEKKVTDGITQVFIREVSQSEKAEALATLLTPDKKLKDGITEDAKLFAKSLLENAKRFKEKELVQVN